MKTRIVLISTFLSVISLSSTAQGFIPVDKANPYQDNYQNYLNISNRDKWGVYNIHDPSIRKFGDTYYCYSTDAMYGHPRDLFADTDFRPGNIQVRSSKNLVDWKFEGWAFDSIPYQGNSWIKQCNNGNGAGNIWAPFILEHNGVYRLYYSLSAFGKKTSYIGLAESNSPLGPWTMKGCAVKTDNNSVMNAIDPTVIVTGEKMYMIYGSFFGGIFCVELNPQTGLPIQEGDQGHLVAHRADYDVENMEAPEVIYNPELNKYFLFVSYGPLVTTYNVRVCVSDNPYGPYYDMSGRNAADKVNISPVLTAPYRFNNHSGWAGVGHNTIFNDGSGHWFSASQARLSPDNMMMDLHVRRLFFTPSGMPVISPERYAGEDLDKQVNQSDLYGKWEIINLKVDDTRNGSPDGQAADNHLLQGQQNISQIVIINKKSVVKFQDHNLSFKLGKTIYKDVKVYYGHDWENQTETLIFTGLDDSGYSVWGKKIK